MSPLRLMTIMMWNSFLIVNKRVGNYYKYKNVWRNVKCYYCIQVAYLISMHFKWRSLMWWEIFRKKNQMFNKKPNTNLDKKCPFSFPSFMWVQYHHPHRGLSQNKNSLEAVMWSLMSRSPPSSLENSISLYEVVIARSLGFYC